MPDETTGSGEEKVFSREDVNKIVSRRVNAMKERLASEGKANPELEKKIKDLEAKLKDTEAKTNKSTLKTSAKELMSRYRLPPEAEAILTESTSQLEMERKAIKLKSLIRREVLRSTPVVSSPRVSRRDVSKRLMNRFIRNKAKK